MTEYLRSCDDAEIVRLMARMHTMPEADPDLRVVIDGLSPGDRGYIKARDAACLMVRHEAKSRGLAERARLMVQAVHGATLSNKERRRRAKGGNKV